MKRKRGGNYKKFVYVGVVALLIVVAVVLMNSNFQKFFKKSFREDLKGEFASLGLGGELEEGLVSYYRFEGNAQDSQNNYDGSIMGATSTTGISGNALHFDGIDDYVSLGGSGDYVSSASVFDNEFQNTFTIGAWIKLDSGALGSLNYVFHKYDNQPGIYIRDNGQVIFSQYHKSGNGFRSSTILQEEQWYHVVYTYNGSTFKGYIDSNLEGSMGKNQYSPGGRVKIGRDEKSPSWDRHFKGKIDEVMVYNRALSEQEIEDLFLLNEIVGDNIVREIESNIVTLNSNFENLDENEILMIAEQVPSDISIVSGSWNYEPNYVLNNTLVWLFVNENSRQFGEHYINQTIPSSLSYQVSGTDGEFKGKWGLKIKDIEGVIYGDRGVGEPLVSTSLSSSEQTTSDGTSGSEQTTSDGTSGGGDSTLESTTQESDSLVNESETDLQQAGVKGSSEESDSQTSTPGRNTPYFIIGAVVILLIVLGIIYYFIKKNKANETKNKGVNLK